MLSSTIGTVVNPFVKAVDVDGIAQRIDFNEILEKVDIDENLIQRIDWNQVLDSIDVDRLVDKIDVNRLLQKVDLVEVMERAEIPQLVVRTTTGGITVFWNALRAQFIMGDRFIQVIGYLRSKSYLPPIPGQEKPAGSRKQSEEVPKGAGMISVVNQGRAAGMFSRVIAFFIDAFVSISALLLIVKLLDVIIEFIRNQPYNVRDEVAQVYLYLVEWTWLYIYFFAGAAAGGQTLGKVVAGLKIVNHEDGSPVEIKRVLIRTVFVCMSLQGFLALFALDRKFSFLFSPGLIDLSFALVRVDRRQLHDVLAGTSVVYSWDARLALYTQELEEEEHQRRVTRSNSLGVSAASNSSRPRTVRKRSTFWLSDDYRKETKGVQRGKTKGETVDDYKLGIIEETDEW